MLRRGNPAILIGITLIIVGGLYFFIFPRLNTPSPFDVVDEGGREEDFLPIVMPIEGEGGLLAPTIVMTPVNSELPREVIGMIPETLKIPAIHLEAPIKPVHYKEIDVGGDIYHQWLVPLEFAAGWQDESALLGVPGNTVLNGHHNAYGMVFKDLVKLSKGDLILVSSEEGEFRYLVVEKLLLSELGETLEQRIENARWMQASQDERLTLVSCWPADSNTHRVVVIAYPDSVAIP